MSATRYQIRDKQNRLWQVVADERDADLTALELDEQYPSIAPFRVQRVSGVD